MNAFPAHRCALVVGALALTTAGCTGNAAPAASGTNVILISIDTLRPDFLGCYGHERDTSPVLDAVATAGTLFSDVTAAAPWTLPSHASMLTGMYPSTHGVKNHDRKLTSETLATRFRDAGYQTMAIVNSHNIGDERYGLLRGFERHEYIFEMETFADGRYLVANRAFLKISNL